MKASYGNAVKAVVFKHNTDVKELLQTFNRMVNECMQAALKLRTTSPIKVERALYNHFNERYGLATHYCISASRVACSSLKSWRRLVGRRRVDPNKPLSSKRQL
jgi:hypothetical protein